jgi:hypothetical protein
MRMYRAETGNLVSGSVTAPPWPSYKLPAGKVCQRPVVARLGFCSPPVQNCTKYVFANGGAQSMRRTNAHVKFLSVEPLLGPLGKLNLRGINWVIVGGDQDLAHDR